MKPRSIIVVVLVLSAVLPAAMRGPGVICAANAFAATLDESFVQDTKVYLSRLEKLGFAGVVCVAEGGKPVIAEGHGLADRERNLPWTPTTIATVGSITKQFTAAGIAKLVEQGRVRFDDPLGKYFPETPPDKKAITLHHLLTHSSGITDPEGIDDFDPVGREDYVRAVLTGQLASAPGERYAYANANFSLLGAVIELVTKKSYEQAMRELVFDPAGLAETGYRIPKWEESRIAQGYTGSERWGTVLERPMAEDGPYWALRANGGIHSTAGEMVHWAETLLEGSTLSPTTRDALWTPYVDESNGDSLSFYGYGWSIVDLAPGIRVVTHNGGNGIFFADLAIVPARHVVAFLQTNVIADFPTANNLLTQIEERMFMGKPYPYVPQVVDVADGALDEWAGDYELDNGQRYVVSVDRNSLRVVPHGWTAYAFIHSPPKENVERLVTMSREIDRVVGACVKGDFTPLFDAYQGKVPIENLRNAYKERLQGQEEQFGPLQGYEVLGTGSGEVHYLTAVRFRHERGDVTRTYAWERSEKNRLLGMIMRPVDPACRFFPVGGERLESWDAITGASIPARVGPSPRGVIEFVLSRGDREIAARRGE